MKTITLTLALMISMHSQAASRICGKISNINAEIALGNKGAFIVFQLGSEEVLLAEPTLISVVLLGKQLDKEVCVSSQNNLGRFEAVAIKD